MFAFFNRKKFVFVIKRYKIKDQMDFLREAEIAFQLCHENILAYYGVVIASSYSPHPALVSYSHLFYILPKDLDSIRYVTNF